MFKKEDNLLNLVVRCAFTKAANIIESDPHMLVPVMLNLVSDEFTAASVAEKKEEPFEEFMDLMVQALAGSPDEGNAVEAAQVLITMLDDHIKKRNSVPRHKMN